MAKRQAKPKQQGPRIDWARFGRGVLWTTVAAVVLAGAVLGGRWLYNPANLPLRSVRVQSGLVRVSGEQIRRIVAPFAAAGILRVDIDGVRKAVEALPWVHRATVRRSWPDALAVTVEEQQAFARWGAGGLLNPDGDRFVPAGKVDGALPLLEGPEGSEHTLTERYGEFTQMLKSVGVGIRRLSMDERRAWSAELSNGMELILGRDAQHERLARFVATYPKILAPRAQRIAGVDLRYTNGFAVRWREAPGGA